MSLDLIIIVLIVTIAALYTIYSIGKNFRKKRSGESMCSGCSCTGGKKKCNQ